MPNEMNVSPAKPPSPRSKYFAALITLGCAFLMAAASCFGFFRSLGPPQGVNSLLSAACVYLFLASLAVLIAAVVWLITLWIKKRLS
jgi:hypothetical protein